MEECLKVEEETASGLKLGDSYPKNVKQDVLDKYFKYAWKKQA